MAAVSLRQTYSFLPTLRFSIIRWLPPVLSSAALNWPTISPSLPSLQSLLELFPSIVLAVPKKKTSHSRKAMRAANKGLKDKQNITNCPGCGAAKLAHHICPNCYSSVTRRWKAQNRESGETILDLS